MLTHVIFLEMVLVSSVLLVCVCLGMIIYLSAFFLLLHIYLFSVSAINFFIVCEEIQQLY
jgi:hypothetical protein